MASTSLQPQDITWSNTQLIDDNLITYISNLKEQPGRDIAIQGSLSVVRQCVEAGIMDEITLIMHPVIVGTGPTLFEGLPLTRLQLISASTTSKGNVIATYTAHVQIQTSTAIPTRTDTLCPKRSLRDERSWGYRLQP